MSENVEIGSESSDYLRIEIISRCHPKATDYWDGNWLNTQIEVRSGGFQGNVIASLRSDEFQSFLQQLEPMCESLEGTAKFQAMEEWLGIDIEADGLGHFFGKCSIIDQLGTGNKLDFSITFDQTKLPRIISQLRAVLEKFPVVGKP